MSKSVRITQVGFEVVGQKYYAYYDDGQFEITKQQQMELSWRMRAGKVMMELPEPAIKTFEQGQEVKVAGYYAAGVVTRGNKHSAENGIDTALVMMGTQVLYCATADVTPTGRILFRRKCRTTQGWSVQWASGRIVVSGERLYPRDVMIHGRNVTVMVHREMALNATEEEIKDDLCEFGQ